MREGEGGGRLRSNATGTTRSLKMLLNSSTRWTDLLKYECQHLGFEGLIDVHIFYKPPQIYVRR